MPCPHKFRTEITARNKKQDLKTRKLCMDFIKVMQGICTLLIGVFILQ
jgi:hypothetical protein